MDERSFEVKKFVVREFILLVDSAFKKYFFLIFSVFLSTTKNRCISKKKKKFQIKCTVLLFIHHTEIGSK